MDIPGYNNLYYVTSAGDVFTHGRPKSGNGKGQHSTPPGKMATFKKFNGYLAVNLWSSDRKLKQKLVHRLVAGAFISNPNNLPQVNHKDSDKTNNCVDNLEWVTPKDNMAHAKEAGVLCGGGRNKFTPEQIDLMRAEYFSGKTLKEVTKQFNCGEVTVWRAVHKIGRNTKHLHFELRD